MRNVPGLDSNEVEMHAQERSAERERILRAEATENVVRGSTGPRLPHVARVRRWLKQATRRD